MGLLIILGIGAALFFLPWFVSVPCIVLAFFLGAFD